MGIFLYNLYIFVWLHHSCQTNMNSALNLSKYYREVVVYIIHSVDSKGTNLILQTKEILGSLSPP